MKKITFITIITAAIFSSCVKQKNCEVCKDREMIGIFQYLEEPIRVAPYGDFTEEKKVVALLDGFCITGSVPSEYKSKEPINVRACVQNVYRKDLIFWAGSPVYKLTCIEKED